MAKGPEAYRTISEAAEEVGVPQHVLRFWETKFPFIKPLKRAGGRRFYRPADIAVLQGVRALLHEHGYTIKGVLRLHKEQGLKKLAEAGGGAPAPAGYDDPDETPMPTGAGGPAAAARLRAALEALETAKARLDAALNRG